MTKSFIRAGIVALIIGVVATAGFYAFLAGAKPETPHQPGFTAFTLVFSALLASVIAAIGAIVTFAFSQYPRSAKVGALFGSVFPVLMTGMAIYTAHQEGKPADLGTVAVMWVLFWPLGFLVSLWVDVKHFVARQVVNGIIKR